MRYVVPLLLLLGLASPAWAAPAFVQSANNFVSAATNTATFSGNCGAGSAVVVFIMNADSGTGLSSITIGGVAATPVDAVATFFSAVLAGTYIRANVPAANCDVVVTWNATVASIVVAHEVSGVDTASPVDGHAINGQLSPGSGTDAVTSTSVTTTVNGDYIFGASFDQADNGQINAGTGFTVRVHQTAGGQRRQTTQELTGNQGIAGSIAATFTDVATNSNNVTAIIALKSSGGVGLSPRHSHIE